MTTEDLSAADKAMIDAAWELHKQAGEPDWPPRMSAIGLRVGTLCNGSIGQLFEAVNGQWVRRFGARNSPLRVLD